MQESAIKVISKGKQKDRKIKTAKKLIFSQDPTETSQKIMKIHTDSRIKSQDKLAYNTNYMTAWQFAYTTSEALSFKPGLGSQTHARVKN